MSNRAEELRKARLGHAVVWLNFQRLYTKRSGDLFCFFEGQDDVKYFGVRIDVAIYGVQRQSLVCDGKDNLLRVRSLINGEPRFNAAWVAFFVDADFDNNTDLELHPSVYVTPTYSIENLYVSAAALLRLLKEEFSIDEAIEPDCENILRQHEACMNSFCDATETLNLWLIEQRKRSRDGGPRLNIRHWAVSDIVSISIHGSIAKYDLLKLAELFPKADVLSQEDIDRHRNSIKHMQRIEKFRGKFLLECFQVFVRSLIEDINAKRPHFFSSHKKVKLTLQTGNVISQLSQYADTPPCLMKFLQKLGARANADPLANSAPSESAL